MKQYVKGNIFQIRTITILPYKNDMGLRRTIIYETILLWQVTSELHISYQKRTGKTDNFASQDMEPRRELPFLEKYIVCSPLTFFLDNSHVFKARIRNVPTQITIFLVLYVLIQWNLAGYEASTHRSLKSITTSVFLFSA